MELPKFDAKRSSDVASDCFHIFILLRGIEYNFYFAERIVVL